MNLRAKFVLSIGLLCLMLPSLVQADTVYTYRGNPYSTCAGIYANSPDVSPVPCNPANFMPGPIPSLYVSFVTTLSGSQLDNLTLGSTGDILSTVTSLTMTDNLFVEADLGGVAAGAGEVLSFEIATDANGNITQWDINLVDGCPPGGEIFNCRNKAFTSNATDETDVTDTIHGYGLNNGNPGSWAVPEPTTLLQLGTGLLGLLLLGIRKPLGRSDGPFGQCAEVFRRPMPLPNHQLQA